MSHTKTERNKEIMEKRKQGMSLSKIGEYFNLHKQTVYDIILREMDKKKARKEKRELSTAL